jgi:hypothetical protein
MPYNTCAKSVYHLLCLYPVKTRASILVSRNVEHDIWFKCLEKHPQQFEEKTAAEDEAEDNYVYVSHRNPIIAACSTNDCFPSVCMLGMTE